LLRSFEAAFIGKGYSQGELHCRAIATAYDSQKAAEKDKELADQCAYWMAKCQLREGKADAAAETLAAAASDFGQSELGPEMAYDRAVALLRSGKRTTLCLTRSVPSSPTMP
jgi:TolA-binding protein